MKDILLMIKYKDKDILNSLNI